MEADKNTSSTPMQPQSTPVMDIQRPRPAAAPPSQPQMAQPPLEETNRPPAGATAPAAEAPAIPTDSPAAVAAPEAGSSDSTNPLAIHSVPAPHKNRAPVGVLLVAFVVMLSLGTLSVFAYLKTQKDSGPVANNSSSKQAPAVSPTEVDDTSKSIDESLKSLDDEKDFVGTELNDATLGL